ncbi:MAG: ribose 1,5-bisphosphate isomerase [Methanocalculus sp. MSAO_Arc1]|uniref:ribose 1,5-bisphosphate isomerase n=1 Tax=Methanocalculus TaxID=71151 RepID=UPI000FF18996|nr:MULTISPECIES: ribose 1,5-bisphosphate isomerase [unclassified Methanocalculus]MCP1662719.1 ribose 1,5-bisphosphate isomerase [Methanocalculus sp. AMF5]RQD79969.1 MAG: ribose 1,5-bisphosphate isomerase [Methanocalculus sp. MSAO_Arc1]
MPLIETAEGIRSMQIRGAGRIARAAAGALRDHAREIDAAGLSHFVSFMEDAAELLRSTRPTAVSLPNAIHIVMRDIHQASDTEEARRSVIRNAEAFIESSEMAVSRIARMGANQINDGDSVLTHCNSEAALACIIEAHRQGREIEVYATEVRPWNQGHLTIETLNRHEIKTHFIVDSAVRVFIHDVDCAIAGADAVCANGSVINKIGTSQIALAAYEAGTKMIIAAETYKFAPKTLLGEMIPIEERSGSEVLPDEMAAKLPFVRVRNPVFDLTPAAYIDSIITEAGVIPPGYAPAIIRDHLGWDIKMIDRELQTGSFGSP